MRLAPSYRESSPGAPRLPEISTVWPNSAIAREMDDSFAVMTAMMAFFDAFRSGDRAQMRAARDLLSTSQRGG